MTGPRMGESSLSDGERLSSSVSGKLGRKVPKHEKEIGPGCSEVDKHYLHSEFHREAEHCVLAIVSRNFFIFK